MSRNTDSAGPDRSRKVDRHRPEARRSSLGRLFRPAGVEGTATDPRLERLEGRALMAIGSPTLIGSVYESLPVANTPPPTVNVPVQVTTSALASGVQGETVIVTVALATTTSTSNLASAVHVTDSVTAAPYHLDSFSQDPTSGNTAVLVFSEYLQESLIVGSSTNIIVTVPGMTQGIAATAVGVEGLLIKSADPSAANSSLQSSGDESGSGTGTSNAATSTTASATANSPVSMGSHASATADELAIGVIGVADPLAAIAGDPTFHSVAVPTGAPAPLALSALTQYKAVSGTPNTTFAASFTTAMAHPWYSSVVTYVAQSPTATDYGYSINLGSTLSTSVIQGVGAGARIYGNPPANSVTYQVVTGPSHATSDGFALDPATGTFSYTPTKYPAQTDSFTYQIHDGNLVSAAQTVTITETNTAPTVTPAGTIAIRQGNDTGLITFAPPAATGGSATGNEYRISSLTNGTLYQADDTTQILETTAGSGVYEITNAQALAGIHFRPFAGKYTGDSVPDAFGFAVAALPAAGDTADLGTPQSVMITVAAPSTPTVFNASPIAENTSTNLTLSVGNPLDVGYVHFLKLTVTGDGQGGTLTAPDLTNSSMTDSYSTVNGAVYYIPVAANGTRTLTFQPASTTTPDFKFTLVAATTNVDSTAILSPGSTPGEVLVQAPLAPSITINPSSLLEDSPAGSLITITEPTTLNHVTNVNVVTQFQLTNLPNSSVGSVYLAALQGSTYVIQGSALTENAKVAALSNVAHLIFVPNSLQNLSSSLTANGPSPLSVTFNVAALTSSMIPAISLASPVPTITVNPVADLSIAFATNASVVNTQQPFAYTATITNHGPSDATNVQFTDHLGPNVTLTSVTISVPGSPPETLTAAQIQQTVTANDTSFVIDFSSLPTFLKLPADPTSGHNMATITINVVPTTAAHKAGSITNTISVQHQDANQSQATGSTSKVSDSLTNSVSSDYLVTSASDSASAGSPDVAGSLRDIIDTIESKPQTGIITIGFNLPSGVTTIVLDRPLPAINFSSVLNGGPIGTSRVITIAEDPSHPFEHPGAFNPLLTIAEPTGSTAAFSAVIQTLNFVTTSADGAVWLDNNPTATAGMSDQLVNDSFSTSGASAGMPTGTGTGILIDAAGSVITSNVVRGFHTGIKIDSASNFIGGSNSGQGQNTIDSNAAYGIQITGPSATNNLVQGNTIGLLQPSTTAGGNGDGIEIDGGANHNVIGSKVSVGPIAGMPDLNDPSVDYNDVLDAANQISLNKNDGVVIAANAGAGNTIRGNSIFLNGLSPTTGRPIATDGSAGQGIQRAGVQPNAPPAPTLLGAVFFQNTLTVQGTMPLAATIGNQLVSYAGATYRIDLYTQTVTNPRDIFGQPTAPSLLNPTPQGKVFLGSIVYDPNTATPGVSKSFTFKLTNTTLTSLVQNDQYITATATVLTADTAPTPVLTVGDTSALPPEGQAAITSPTPIIVTNGLQVTTTADSGPGSLREAINNANLLAMSGASSTIIFNVPTTPGHDVQTIKLASPLPAIDAATNSPNVSITIDGYTQANARPRFAIGGSETPATLTIVIDGSQIAASGLANASGMILKSGMVTIEGLQFEGFKAGTAAILVNGADGAQISGDVFGVSTGNSGDAIEVAASTGATVTNLLIGGPGVADRNIIDGSTGSGIELQYSTLPATSSLTGVTIQGNFVGVEADGTTALGNANGISIDPVAGSAAGSANLSGVVIEGNTIAANGGSGVLATGAPGLSISGNRIGTNSAGTAASGTQGIGVHLIGVSGGSVVGNTISSNTQYGVFLDGSSAVIVAGNKIGTTGDGTTALGNGNGATSAGVYISGSGSNGNTIGGTSPGSGNTISGNAGSGVLISGAGATGELVEGNTIGLDGTGTRSLGTQLDGIHVLNGTTTTGGVVSDGGTIAGNTISGNVDHGVYLDNSSLFYVSGNDIGTDKTGTLAVGGQMVGVFLDGTQLDSTHSKMSFGNLIGNSVAGPGNVISGNSVAGVLIQGSGATAESVQGNEIGTDLNGIKAVGGQQIGVQVEDVANVTGGAGVQISANTISGNSLDGVYLLKSSRATVSGNKIGTNAAGSVSLANGSGLGIGGAGVFIFDDQAITNTSSSNTIGGTSPGSGNTISGNAGSGVLISGAGATGELVEGNTIGLDGLGGQSLGVQSYGVHLLGVVGATIGGSSAAARNVISGNAVVGVYLDNASSIAVEGNYLGTNGAGSGSVGNQMVGILLDGISKLTGADTIGGSGGGQGNLISGNSASGVVIQGAGASLDQVQGNRIGTDATGTQSIGGQHIGIHVDQVAGTSIGGTLPGQSNLISGNSSAGVFLDGSSGVSVQGNQVGTNAASTGTVANAIGVLIGGNDRGNNTIGGTVAGASNVVGGNSLSGIEIDAPSLLIDYVQDNSIRGNDGDGILLKATTGVQVVGNVVDSNLGNGIDAVGTTNTIILNNFVGTDLGNQANTALGNLQDGIHINGLLQTDPNLPGVKGNIVVENGGNGISVANATGLTISSNLVGVITANDATSAAANKLDGVNLSGGANAPGAASVTLLGNTVSDNGQDGLDLVGATNVQVGPTNAFDFNKSSGVEFGGSSRSNTLAGGTITGNVADGIKVDGSSNNLIFGTSVTSNASDGIQITGNSSGNTVSGGTIAGNIGNGVDLFANVGDSVVADAIQGVVIVGNHNNGVLIDGTGASSNALVLNTIGLAGAGLANLNNGISILGAGPSNLVQFNTVGFSDNFGLSIANTPSSTVSTNIIAENSSDGVVLSGALASKNQLVGNLIAKNKLAGLLLLNVPANYIGNVGSGNTITGNSTDGVDVFQSTGSSIVGNFIGTDSANSSFKGNSGDGIHLIGASTNFIAANTVSANTQSAVEIFGNSLSNAVAYNVLGTQSSDPNLANKLDGVLISGSLASDPTNGTSDPKFNYLLDNTVSGNKANGVAINLADTNYLEGNRIGQFVPGGSTNQVAGVSVSYSNGTVIANGNLVLGNSADGINLVQATATLVKGNTVGGNAGSGVDLTQSTATSIVFNTIALNRVDGISLTQQSSSSTLEYNTVARNSGDGIGLDHSSGNQVLANLIRSNAADGLRLQDASTGNLIGLDLAGDPALGNQIAGNTGAGVEISTQSTGNSLQNNTIGSVDPLNVPGNAVGVFLNQVSGNVVGGPSLATANTITGNRTYGVEAAGNLPGGGAFPDNTLQDNLIGTDTGGNSPASFVPGLADVGVFLLNSPNNLIVGNVVSGNHAAGIELFGMQSSGNVLAANLVGSNLAGTGPVLTVPEPSLQAYLLKAEEYSAADRQLYGIWLNGAANNTIDAANTILGNFDGVYIQGGSAIGNLVTNNNVGYYNGEPHDPYTNGLGNVTGVFIDDTSSNTVAGNLLARNMLTGVSIVGSAATFNKVQSNTIDANGGFGTVDPNGLDYIVSDPAPGATIFVGTGVYIDSGTSNIVGADINGGSHPDPATVALQGNHISDNTVAGVYVNDFGFGLAARTTNFNSIADNVIVPTGNIGGPTSYIGQYGILLFNSSGNIPGVLPTGPYANQISPANIATYREYTGPSNPNIGMVPGASAASVKVASVGGVKAASASTSTSVPVIVNAGGKGHPLPPARKNHARKS